MGCIALNSKDEFEINRIRFINKERHIRNIYNLINKKNNDYNYVKAKFEYSKQLPTLLNDLHDEYKKLEDIFNEQDKKFMLNSKERAIKSRYLEAYRVKINQYDVSDHVNVLYN